MEITKVAFEEKLILTKNNQRIVLIPFMTQEQGNIKFGIEAPKGISVDREEIFILKQQKRRQKEAAETL
ncbi:carbon storage regulator [Legionella saoudiensis]|uniref:carbon storage regulator n=1 Tax=Legionella saoudiensis TaxID=1750561 RepID=UPI00073157C7|nr:carbon storage regulator [Legionella saoudiensis]